MAWANGGEHVGLNRMKKKARIVILTDHSINNKGKGGSLIIVNEMKNVMRLRDGCVDHDGSKEPIESKSCSVTFFFGRCCLFLL
jgi:hypothetical protein